jgi:hypothetical protein
MRRIPLSLSWPADFREPFLEKTLPLLLVNTGSLKQSGRGGCPARPLQKKASANSCQRFFTPNWRRDR